MSETSIEPNIKAIVLDALEDIKGQDIVCLDVSGLSDVMDFMVVASGGSSTQVKALANNVVEKCKHSGCQPLGVEGMESSEWVLVDLGDVVVHIMTPATRSFYELEKLWSMRPEDMRKSKEEFIAEGGMDQKTLGED